MQNEMNEKANNNQGFLQAEPAELDETALLCVSAGLMMVNPRTDCICCKACATATC